jgi:hypothetical protein
MSLLYICGSSKGELPVYSKSPSGGSGMPSLEVFGTPNERAVSSAAASRSMPAAAAAAAVSVLCVRVLVVWVSAAVGGGGNEVG